MDIRPHFSVVIPAHNEQQLLRRGLLAVQRAVDRCNRPAEIIVVANRCTDRTEAIARDFGAMVVVDDSPNPSVIRNRGVAASSGEIVVTIDADSVMHRNALVEVHRLVGTGHVVGGGCRPVPERRSPGIVLTLALLRAATEVVGLGGAMLWCHRDDFDAIGGFDESLTVGEDLDFARRLSHHGHLTGRRFTNVRDAPVTISCRRSDVVGEWHALSPLFHH